MALDSNIAPKDFYIESSLLDMIEENEILQGIMKIKYSQKIRDAYFKILDENNLDFREHELFIEGPLFDGDSFALGKMKIRISVKQKPKLAPND